MCNSLEKRGIRKYEHRLPSIESKAGRGVMLSSGLGVKKEKNLDPLSP
jgi:hypothetical protein